jgi:hypothetical protein
MIPPETSNELPEEFAASTQLERLHRYVIHGDGSELTVYFGLLAADGILHRFKTDLDGISSLVPQINGIAELAQATAKKVGLPQPIIKFETTMMMFAHAFGHGHAGDLSLFITLPHGQMFSTTIDPVLASQLLMNLRDQLDSLPTPPPAFPSALAPVTPTIPGTPRDGETRTHFGQEYRADILEALGLLVVRANLLEESLIKLMSVIGKLPFEQAEALFNSVVNLNSRIQMIRALIVGSDLTAQEIGLSEGSLDEASNVAGRRNDLVHGEWSFKKDKFEVKSFRQRQKGRSQGLIVNAAYVETLAADYRAASIQIESVAGIIMTRRNSPTTATGS